jgi:hypothetical protein
MNSVSEKNISLLSAEKIDLDKWDRCIRLSPNGLIYGHSFYLSRMARNWAGLILNDYEAVMPLSWNRKYGFSYLYQPPFTAQLGIFSPDIIDKHLTDAFILQCKKNFSFCEMHLNHGNCVATLPEKANYALNLQPGYEQIRKGYRKDLIQNLKYAEQQVLHYGASSDYQEVISLFKKIYGKRLAHVGPPDYQRFSAVCSDLFEKEMGIVRTVTDNNLPELLAAGVFLRDEKRIYNIMNVTLAAGRERMANHFLLDRMIKEFSGQQLVLDFEGSQIAGIAEFYRQFGSTPEPYPFLRFNQLPVPFRYFKKR